MSNSDFSPSPSSNDHTWSDSVVDSLLLEKARHTNGDDEAFLQSMEAVLDEEEKATVVVPIRKRSRILAWSTTAAAVLILACYGINALFLETTDELPISQSEDTLIPPVNPIAKGQPKSETPSDSPATAPEGPADVAIAMSGPGIETTEKPSSPVAPEESQASPSKPPYFSSEEGVPTIASSYVQRGMEQVKKADEAALRGSRLISDGDYQGAIDQLRTALDLLPEAPTTEPRRRAYISQFSRASVLLATERADEGRYPESIALVEEVLQPSVDPSNIDARRMLERLNDPDYYSPGLTPSHLERVRRVQLALKTAEGFMDLGDFDRADREFHKSLNDDPYNVAASRGQQKNERHRMNYYDQSYNQTRAKMLKEVAAGWEMPVPTGSKPPSDAAPQPSSVSLASGGAGNRKTHDKVIRRKFDTSSIGSGSNVPTQTTREISFGSGVSRIENPTGFTAITKSNFATFGESSQARYGTLVDNAWFTPLETPLSTFSIDVDTASWSNVRNMIRNGTTADQIPDDAVRIEELINYFDWEYPQPEGEHPFAFAVETAACPWNTDHQLMRVGIQGKELLRTDRPDSNLVFLLDVSGSMNQPNKLPLVKRAISVLVEELREKDRIAIVVYAGAEGLALPTVSGRDQSTIQSALDSLGAGGSTNGGAGIKLAYRMARKQFIEGGVNRVILCTDGDFNVGTTGTTDLVNLVEKEAESGVFLSVCGFGTDNLNDAMLEEITNRGNGNYFYIDTFREGRKVFLSDLMGTLVTIAKDVKIQIEFNPAQVDGYRLIGYANRKLEAEDFENDEIDAGEVGSGHSVTALYEVVPAGTKDNPAKTSELRYQKPVAQPQPKRTLVPSEELALLKLRYKQPDGEVSTLMEEPVLPNRQDWRNASDDYRFAAAVGMFGMILREHESVKRVELADVIALARGARGDDSQGYRAEFVDIVKQLANAE